MSAEDDVISVIEGFYAAAAGGCDWCDPLDALKRLLGFSGVCLRIFDRDGRTVLRHWDGLDERTWPAYEAYYAAIHPGEQYARKHPGRFIYYTYLCTPEVEIDRSEYYDWNMRERGLCYSLVGRTGREAPFIARVPLHRPRSAGHPSPDEIALYERLFRHIERALLLAYRLDLAPLPVPGADVLLESRPHGIVLLDRSGGVLFANRAARAMAALADGFALASSGLRALRQGDDDILQRLIGSAVQGGGDPLARGGAMRLPRRSGKRDYALLVTPLPSRAGLFVGLAPAVCVSIADPDDAPGPPFRLLRDLYRATPAELRLAERLAQGDTLKEAGAGLGIAVKTARDHLSALLRKTETRRQADLIRLVQSLAEVRGAAR